MYPHDANKGLLFALLVKPFSVYLNAQHSVPTIGLI